MSGGREEVGRLTDEWVSLLVELGIAKRSCLFSAQRSLKRRTPWRQNMMLALKPSSITDTAAAPLPTIFVEASLIFRRDAGTSNPLTLEFFINHRCPPVVVPVGAVVSPKAGVSEEVKHPLTAGVKASDNPDLLSRVAGRGRILVHPMRVKSDILWFLAQPGFFDPILCPNIYMM